MISKIDDYFVKGCGRCERFDSAECSALQWREGLLLLREICRSCDVNETVKWGHPCYVGAGRNVAIVGALRSEFRLSFFNAGLMQDPNGVLERPGPNTQYPDMIRFVSARQVKALAEVIRAYMNEAIEYAKAGRKAPKVERHLQTPDELTEALMADPELADAFARLTPGRQNSYLVNLGRAKKPETRVRRIEKFRVKILAGKGALER